MPKKSKKSSITLNGLARMVSKGFEEAADDRNKRFGEVNKRLEHIEDRLDRIEKKILENHEKRIRRLEEALSL